MNAMVVREPSLPSLLSPISKPEQCGVSRMTTESSSPLGGNFFAERVTNFLRIVHPTDTAKRVARDLRCSPARVKKWLDIAAASTRLPCCSPTGRTSRLPYGRNARPNGVSTRPEISGSAPLKRASLPIAANSKRFCLIADSGRAGRALVPRVFGSPERLSANANRDMVGRLLGRPRRNFRYLGSCHERSRNWVSRRCALVPQEGARMTPQTSYERHITAIEQAERDGVAFAKLGAIDDAQRIRVELAMINLGPETTPREAFKIMRRADQARTVISNEMDKGN